MRDYGKVASTFWTGQTGRLLREDRDSQVVAMYLLTGPLANMIGLYHLPIALLSDHTGIPFKGASKALQRVCDVGFCRYEAVLEHVFVTEMAAYQCGEPLKETDLRVKGIISQWQTYRKSPFYIQFHDRYKDSYHLPDPKPLLRAYEAPTKPGAGAGAGAGEETGAGEKQDIAASPDVPVKDTKVRPRNHLFDAIAEVTGLDPQLEGIGATIGMVAAKLAKADPPYTPEEVFSFAGRFWEFCDWARDKGRERPTPTELGKWISLLRAKPAPKQSIPSKNGKPDLTQQTIDNGNEFIRLTGGLPQ